MTILQLKYVIALANASSMREAASKLFVTQPALSSMIRELEEELQIQIFKRNNKGIALTSEGREFLTYAKQAVSQYLLIEDRYAKNERDKVHFSVSMQHYVFAVKAFLKVICEFSYDRYTYSVQETKTDEVLTNVRDLKSEIGIISYSKGNENLFKKLFREFGLSFHPLMIRDTYAYLWKDHPLADREEISLDDLREYPCISFDQSSENDFYLIEEALGEYNFEKKIKSNDRATSMEIMAGMNGFSIGTGIMTESIAISNDYVCIKLKEDDPLTIGYILKAGHSLSEIGQRYAEELEKYKEE